MAGHGKGVNFNLLTRPLRVGRDSGTRQIHSRLLTTNWSARSLGPEGLVPNFLVPGCGLLVRRRGQHLVRLSCLILPSLILHKNAGAESRFNLFQSQEATFLSPSRQSTIRIPSDSRLSLSTGPQRLIYRHISPCVPVHSGTSLAFTPRHLPTQSVLVGST